MGTPKILHVANLWSLKDYPSTANPWSLEEQLDAVKSAGFDGFTARLGPKHAREAEKRELSVVGYFSSADETQFPDLLKSQKDAGARHINVQLVDHDTTPEHALRLTLHLMEEADRIGDIELAVEVHRALRHRKKPDKISENGLWKNAGLNYVWPSSPESNSLLSSEWRLENECHHYYYVTRQSRKPKDHRRG